MSKALIAGINQVATDKGLDREIIFEAIEAALVSAYKRNFGSVANVTAAVDRMSGDMQVFAEKEVVDEVMNPRTEIAIEAAKKLAPEVDIHDVIKIPSTPGNFGRIAAQTAKQVILQRIREAERDTVYENYVHRVSELINAQVRSIDTLSGTVTVMLDDKHESLLPRDEQIPNERLRRGDFIKLYIVDVQKGNRGPMIKLSRTHRNLLRRLMEQEIPEVRDGSVEIKNIAREPGARSKVAVLGTAPGVDPVGSCVGLRGMRIQNIVGELAGEKIDVVEWSNAIRTYISNALSPAKVVVVILEEENNAKTATVVVEDRQLSLAIGKAGQNARLAAKLTGWRIDIKSETEAVAEGYDLLAAKEIQDAAGRGDDLLSRAAVLLDTSRAAADESGEDMLDLAARMLQQQPEVEEPVAKVDLFGDLPPTPDLPKVDLWSAAKEVDEPKTPKTLDSFEDLASRIAAEEASLRQFTESLEIEETPKQEEDLLARAAKLFEDTEGEDTAEDIISDMQEELPEVITADMLRARREKKVDLDDMDFEIPEELLAGLLDENLGEEDELDDIFEEMESKSKKGKRGKQPKKPTKKSKKKRRPVYGDDDYDDYI
jgi:N utilization substance protein A